MIYRTGLFFWIFIFVVSCKVKDISSIDYSSPDNWILADYEKDSLLGISSDKFSKTVKLNLKSPLAILDQPIDIDDSLISKFLWVNAKEVPANEKDDDLNSYTDDINGWNFRGGNNNIHASYGQTQSLRIIKYFKNRPYRSENDKLLLQKAEILHEKNLATSLADQAYAYKMKDLLKEHQEKVIPYLNEKAPTIKNLNALVRKLSIDSIIRQSASILINFDKYGYSQENIKNLIENSEVRISKSLNVDFEERSIQNDDLYDLNDSVYGNSKVNLLLDTNSHGTRVASVAASLFNTLSQKQKEYLKIMPVIISGNETNTDKDIAIGIRYAVNNGAKIINMSFGKELTLNSNWITDAIKYAAQNDVLIVTSAGNDSKDITQELNANFPNDRLKDGTELFSNFLKIGSSTKNIKAPKSSWSNYSKEDVDLFAPGDSLKTRYPNNVEKWDSGSSLSSALVASIATIIRSSYPSLTAPQVKQILMDSSVKYDIMVDVPTKENPKQQLPFSELSKSGGIVNAYNALLMAEEVSKNK